MQEVRKKIIGAAVLLLLGLLLAIFYPSKKSPEPPKTPPIAQTQKTISTRTTPEKKIVPRKHKRPAADLPVPQEEEEGC